MSQKSFNEHNFSGNNGHWVSLSNFYNVDIIPTGRLGIVNVCVTATTEDIIRRSESTHGK